MDKQDVIQVAVVVTPAQLKGIEAFLRLRRIQYFVIPPPDPPYADLQEIKDACNRK